MKAALIIVDMQNDFKRGASDYFCSMLTGVLIQNIKKLIEVCRKNKIPFIYTQHTIKKDKSNAEQGEPKNVRACIEGTYGWEIIDDIKPHKNDVVIKKDTFNAFFGTNLHQKLKKLGRDSVIFCGVHTNNCVRSTAEAAYAYQYRLILIRDCCGATDFVPDMTAEETNTFTLKELANRTYDTVLVQRKDVRQLM